jgi:hypothetical protein
MNNIPNLTSNTRYELIENIDHLNIVSVQKHENSISAIETLKNMQTIVQNEKFIHQWDTLSLVAKEILENYRQRFANLGLLNQFIYKGNLTEVEDQVAKLNKIIEIRKANLQSPPLFFPLSEDIIHIICSSLTLKDIKKLSLLNRTAKLYTDHHYFFKAATALAFPSATMPLNSFNAKMFCYYSLPRLISSLFKGNFINKDFVVFNDESKCNIDIDKTLAKFKQMKLSPTAYLIPYANKKSVLHHVIEEKDFVGFLTLLGYGIDQNSKDSKGNTPLHLVVGNLPLEFASKLIELGADINAINDEGLTPLCGAFSLTMIKFLIEKGANVDYQNPKNGWTFLHYVIARAPSSTSIEKIQQIIDLASAYSSKDIKNKQDNFHRTPLQMLALRKDREKTEQLERRMANLSNNSSFYSGNNIGMTHLYG